MLTQDTAGCCHGHEPVQRSGKASEAALQRMNAALAAVEHDATLWAEDAYAARALALDELDRHVAQRLAALRNTGTGQDSLVALQERTEALMQRLDSVDAVLLARLRRDIRSGRCGGDQLRRRLHSYSAGQAGNEHSALLYDLADRFVNDLFLVEPIPQDVTLPDPEMVAYQPAPVRIVLNLLDMAGFEQGDIFYDLGSGLGRVVLLVGLVAGVRARGIEVDPACCAYARRCAASLALRDVDFIEADARSADLAAGTVFFMYTPFRGAMLRTVLQRLQQTSQRRRITLFTYGPCTRAAGQEPWLAPAADVAGTDAKDVEERLAAFVSR